MLFRTYDGNMIDLTAADFLEIVIDKSGGVVWINTEEGCLLRACRFKQLIVKDERVITIDEVPRLIEQATSQQIKPSADGLEKLREINDAESDQDGINRKLPPS